MKSVVAFVGFKSSGKNTAAEALLPYNFVSLSFADALKDCLASIFCWPRDMLEGITGESREWREQIDTWWAARLEIPQFTPRWAMQNFGTEVMRRHFKEDIWVFNVERRMLMVDDNTSVILVDGRFPNEIELARRYNGKILRVKRGNDPLWMETAEMANRGSSIHFTEMKYLGIHESEWAWIGTPIDAVIENNGSITDLHSQVVSSVIKNTP